MKNANLKLVILLACLALIVFIALTAIFSCTSIAYAQGETNAIVAPVSNLKDNAYAGISTIKLLSWGEAEPFYIPESYYLTSIDELPSQPGKYMVKYCGSFFIYEDDDLTLSAINLDDGDSGEPDVRVFLNNTDSVKYVGTTPITNDHTIKLLGFSADGTKLYVHAILNGSGPYGFINASDVQPFNVPYHPIAQAQRNELLASLQQPEASGGDILPNTSLGLKIALIIGIAIPAVIIAVLLFKPTKNTKRVISTQSKDFDYDEPQDRRQR